jgi:hypothetical protein
MYKVLFTILFFSLSELSALAQQKYNSIRFYLRPSIGGVLPITPYHPNYITDDLTSLPSRKGYFQPFAMGFFYQNFGIEGSIVLTPSKNIASRSQRVLEKIDQHYGTQYHIQIINTDLGIDGNDPDDPVVRWGIGPAYKIEKGKWVLFGCTKLGLISFGTSSLHAALKGKGNNDRIKIDFTTHSTTKEFFAVNPSATVSYRLGRKLALEMDIGSWIYKLKMSYTENTENLNSETLQTAKYEYSHLMNELTIGLALKIIIR